MTRKPYSAAPHLREDWQVAQAHHCPCQGFDDMCVCQNVNEPWNYGLPGERPPTREQQLEVRVRELEGHVRTLELQQQTDRQTIENLRSPSSTEGLVKAAEEGLSGWAPVNIVDAGNLAIGDTVLVRMQVLSRPTNDYRGLYYVRCDDPYEKGPKLSTIVLTSRIVARQALSDPASLTRDERK